MISDCVYANASSFVSVEVVACLIKTLSLELLPIGVN